MQKNSYYILQHLQTYFLEYQKKVESIFNRITSSAGITHSYVSSTLLPSSIRMCCCTLR